MAEGTPFNVKCFSCKHVWPLLHLPMPLLQAATLMKAAACPSCGATKHIFAAPGEAATEAAP